MRITPPAAEAGTGVCALGGMGAPYVGPRPFVRAERDRFYGREREARALLALIRAERVVLLHGPAGAGKTSLLNTRIIPALEAGGVTPLPAIRLALPLPPALASALAGPEGEDENVFLLNTLLALAPADTPPRSLLGQSLPAFLQSTLPSPALPLLILDPFDALFTAHRERWQDIAPFLAQLRRALDALPYLSVLLVMRSEHVAALSPYARLFPRRLSARFYLESLDYRAALEAVQVPAAQFGRPFAPGVAEALVNDLRWARDPGGPQYVDGLRLQVLCRRLWERVVEAPSGPIGHEDVAALGPASRAVADFYTEAVAGAATQTSESEAAARDWIERALITARGEPAWVARQIHRTAGLSTRATEALLDAGLLAEIVHGGQRGYALAHAGLVAPIRAANRAWRAQQPGVRALGDFALAELSPLAQTVAVEQTVLYEIALAHHGERASRFACEVEDLPPDWLVLPPEITVQPGQRVTLTLEVTPPRAPESRAGAQRFGVRIVALDEEIGAHFDAELTLAPYYDVALAPLRPERQSLARGRTATALAHVSNRGNAPARVLLRGAARGGATLAFGVPGEAGGASSVTLELPVASSAAVPVEIAPRRRWLGLRAQRHGFTVTAEVQDDRRTMRSQAGEVRVAPRLGAPAILLLALLSLVALLLALDPRIKSFEAEPPIAAAGEPVMLRWEARDVADLRLESGSGEIMPAVQGTHTSLIVHPTEDTVYTLHARNLLSELPLIGPRFRHTAQVYVKVAPLAPFIHSFEATPNPTIAGTPVTLRWLVDGAESLALFVDGQPEVLLATEIERRERVLRAPEGLTSLTLLARNRYGTVEHTITVRAYAPTPTAMPVPRIVSFEAVPETVAAGGEVTLRWRVENAARVELFGEFYFPEGQTTLTLTEVGTVEFVITAINESIQGQQRVVSDPVRVEVVPAATPTP